MVRAGCVFVAGISPSRTWMSGGSFGSLQWKAYAQTRPRFILSSELLGNGVRTHVNPEGKSPLPMAEGRVGPGTLHHCGQQAQHTTDTAIPAPKRCIRLSRAVCLLVGWLLNVPATCECISGTDLLRQFYVLPH